VSDSTEGLREILHAQTGEIVGEYLDLIDSFINSGIDVPESRRAWWVFLKVLSLEYTQLEALHTTARMVENDS